MPSDRAHRDAFGNRQVDPLRPDYVLLRLVDALARVLGKLGVEQAARGAGREGVVVVQDDFEAILLGLLHSGVIQLEVFGAEKLDALRARSAAGEFLEIVRGKTERGGASGFEEEAAVVQLLGLIHFRGEALGGVPGHIDAAHGVAAVLRGRGLEGLRVEVGSRRRLAQCGDARAQGEEQRCDENGADGGQKHGSYLAAFRARSFRCG